MDLEGLVLVLVLWVTGIDRPAEYLMPNEPFSLCLEFATKLAPRLEKELEVPVSMGCFYKPTAIVEYISPLKRLG